MSKTVKINHNRATKKLRKNESFSRFDDKKIRQNDHLDQVQYLMFNAEPALRLALDNLILTYGVQAVQKSLKATDLKTIQKAKKVA